ncbi:MAG TPA: YraN family protein [Candidatus Acidoferrales bacterium]|nr:YraN family protein [Candidatus Acidoferrales bacterium]
MIARLMFAIVDFAARKGLAEADQTESMKEQARRTGIRGETYAYWYLRRHGYVLVARNYRSPGMKGEIDMVGYDGQVLAFVEVKTRSADAQKDPAKPQPRPEEAVNWEKRRNLTRMARQFLRARRIESAECRFDVMAIENRAGARPEVRLHKGAFGTG